MLITPTMIVLGSAFAAAVTAGTLISEHIDKEKEKKATALFDRLDHGSSRTMSLTQKPGDVTDEFYKAALKASKDNRFYNRHYGLSYEDGELCKSNHPDFKDDSLRTFMPAGEGALYVKYEYYKPRVIGFQVAADDPKTAVPIFMSHNPQQGIRGDGKTVSLDF